jgi:large repetitive protein
MSKQYTLALHVPGSEAAPTRHGVPVNAGKQGATVRVKVPLRGRAELIEDARNAAPDNIRIKRSGKDLHVAFEGSDINKPDLVLEGYYEQDTGDLRLVGRDDAGAYHEYIPENTQPNEYVGRMADDKPSGQVLGQDTIPAAWIAGSGGAISPWYALAALPVLGLAGGGGGGASPAPAVSVESPQGILDPGSDSAAKGDSITRDSTPMISGTGTPGHTIEVTVGGQSMRTTVAADGTWSVTLPQPLADGDYDAQIIQIDPQGRASAPATTSLTVDTQAPTLTAALQSASDSAAPDAITNDTTPSIEGRGEPGTMVTVRVAGQVLTTTVAADGTWSVTPDALPDGAYTFDVSSMDVAGNTATTSVEVTVDTIIGSRGALAPASDSGTLGDGITNDTTPTLTGAGTPGDSIRVVIGGQTLNTTVAADGTWSVTPPTPLPDGAVTASVTRTDAAGNTATDDIQFTIDATQPLLTAALDAASDSGVPGDGITSDSTPTLRGTGEPGAAIAVTVGGQTLNTTVAADGRWSVTPTALADGPYAASVVATDAAGNASDPQTVSFTVDTAAPALTAVLDPSSDSGVTLDNVTRDTTPTISGTSEPGATIAVSLPSGEVLTVVAADDGAWSVTPTVALADGLQNVTVTSTDAAGNVASAAVPVTIDTTLFTAPRVVISSDADNNTFLNASELGSNTTVAVTIGLPAQAAVGDTLLVSDGVTPQSIVLTADNITAGSVAATVARAPEGQLLTVSASLIDPAGNTSPAAIDSASVDTLATVAPVVTITTDGGAGNALLANDGTVNAAEIGSDTTFAVSIALPGTALEGDLLEIRDNAGNLRSFTLTAAMIGTGTVTTTFPMPSEDATFTATATVTDVAGNVSLPGSDSARLDRFAPEAPSVTLTGDANNNGYLSSSESGLAAQQSVRIGLPTSGPALVPGDTLTVASSSGTTLTITLDAAQITAGFVDVAVATPAEGARLDVEAYLTDRSGNRSPRASDSATVDTVAPAAPIVSIADDSDNNGFIRGSELVGQLDVTVTLPIGGAGQSQIGDTVVLTDQAGNERRVTITDADFATGSVGVTFPAPVEGATFSVSARLIDAAGNVGANSAPDSAVIDTLAPAAPPLQLAPASDSGVAGDNRTSDTTPLLRGTGTPGSTVTLTGPTGEVLTAPVAADGTWSVQSTAVLADGPRVFTATATDTAGNISPSNTLTVTIDTAAPAVTAALASASDTGLVGDLTTNLSTPAISGTGEPGARISVQVASQTLNTTVAANGTWSVTPTALPDATYTVQVQATDAAGNSANTAATIIVDTTAPTVTITLAPTSDSGVAGDSRTADSTPELTGVTAPGVTVTVRVGGQTLTAVADADGVWTVTPTALIDGPVVASVVVTDAAGNASAPSTLALVIDTAAPALAAQLAPASDSGVPGDNRTNDPTPTISGTGEAGASISVVVGGQTLTTTVAANGTWSVTPAALTDGSYTAAVTETDAAGNTTIASVPVTIDASTTGLTAVLAPTSDSGLAGDNRTNNTTPTIRGTGEIGATVTVVIDGQTLVTTVAPDGTWSVIPTTLADGPYTAAVTLTDAAGNTAAASVALTIDTVSDNLTAVLDPSSDSGRAGDNRTSDTTPTISGTGEPDASISVVVGSETLTTTVAADGTWSVIPTEVVPDGSYSFDVVQVDTAGNIDTTSVQVVIDTRAPALAASLAPTSDSGRVGDNRTNDPTPTIGGTAEPFASISVVIGGQTLTTTVDTNGSWSVTPTALTDGDYTAVVTASDASGNTTTASVPVAIDTIAPTLTAVLSPASDSGTAGDNRTNDTVPTISGTSEAGATVSVTMPTGEVLRVVADSSGNWTAAPTAAWPAGGPQTVQVRSVDAAGNATTSTLAITIDDEATAAPTVVISGDANNDEWLNSADVGAASTVPVTITLPAGAAIGDTLRVVVSGMSQDIVLTSLDPVTIDAALPAQGQALTVSASLIDIAGNASASASDAAVRDTVAPSTPVVSILTDANNSGVINTAELGSATQLEVGVFLPTDAIAGDVLTVTDGVGNVRNVTVTAAMVAAQLASPTVPAVTVQLPVMAEDTAATVRATITDAADNASGQGSDSAVRDTVGPDAPIVTLRTDTNNDGYFNAAEVAAASGAPVRLTLPTTGAGAAQPGDVISVSDNLGTVYTPITITAAMLTAGFVDVAAPAPAEGAPLVVSAFITDASSNVSDTSSDAGVRDTVAPTAPQVRISEDTNNDGFLNSGESSGVVSVAILLVPAGAAVGDRLRATDNAGNVREVTLAAADIAAGSIDTTFPAPAQGSTLVVTAQVIDRAGNAGLTANDSVVLDTTAPVAPPAFIAASSDTGLQGDGRTLDTTPTITGTGATPGDTITVVLGGQTLVAPVAADGTWSVTPSILAEGPYSHRPGGQREPSHQRAGGDRHHRTRTHRAARRCLRHRRGRR